MHSKLYLNWLQNSVSFFSCTADFFLSDLSTIIFYSNGQKEELILNSYAFFLLRHHSFSFFLHYLTNFSSYFWFRMEIWHALQEELNRLYEMFVQRNPYFETNGGKVSIVAHSLGCVVTYDILTGWTQDVEHSWYNLQTRGGGNGMQDLKRSRHFRRPSTHGQAGNLHATPAQSGLLFRIENFFCLGTNVFYNYE